MVASKSSRSPSPGSRCWRHCCCQTWPAATAVGMLVLLLVPLVWVGAFVKHPCPLRSSSSFIPPVHVGHPSVDTRNCAVSESAVWRRFCGLHTVVDHDHGPPAYPYCRILQMFSNGNHRVCSDSNEKNIRIQGAVLPCVLLSDQCAL